MRKYKRVAACVLTLAMLCGMNQTDVMASDKCDDSQYRTQIDDLRDDTKHSVFYGCSSLKEIKVEKIINSIIQRRNCG